MIHKHFLLKINFRSGNSETIWVSSFDFKHIGGQCSSYEIHHLHAIKKIRFMSPDDIESARVLKTRYRLYK